MHSFVTYLRAFSAGFAATLAANVAIYLFVVWAIELYERPHHPPMLLYGPLVAVMIAPAMMQIAWLPLLARWSRASDAWWEGAATVALIVAALNVVDFFVGHALATQVFRWI